MTDTDRELMAGGNQCGDHVEWASSGQTEMLRVGFGGVSRRYTGHASKQDLFPCGISAFADDCCANE
ncbi:hypothetical protein EV207_12912 [Scopulibacillus darangshiensis]|uniref:Uncharacterized protein n=1 Tax=Scopulibacillus darangshiensis TaxID=442528 RepID=A0A4R2NQQ9_9BACL|nr:hypothetical protein EV207_12912 [Scopulibacillus darangshiensis]